jgi:hypothetical protein
LKGVVSIFPNRKRELLTTRTWDFIGLTQYWKDNIMKVMLWLGLSIVEFGQNLLASLTKVLVHHLPNGKADAVVIILLAIGN